MAERAHIEDLLAMDRSGSTEKATWDTHFQELADYVCPRKGQITERDIYPNESRESRLWDSTAVQSNQILAQGQLAYVSPKEERWFLFTPPEHLEGNEQAVSWYQRCTEIAERRLANSNFYSEIHEAYLDRSGFGICNILASPSADNPSGLYFAVQPVESYWIGEDHEKQVDTVCVSREMTPRQMAQKFGEDALPKNVRKDYGNPAERCKKYVVKHLVYPRDDSGGSLNPLDAKFASVWFIPSEKAILFESGFRHNPYAVSRYLRWGSAIYGWCPGWMAMPDARQVNFLEKIQDLLAELQVFPRVLNPATGAADNLDIDMGSGGVTDYNPFSGDSPKEWLTGGRIMDGEVRAERKRKAIRDAYHVDLFKLFAELDRPQMTAREVAERASEKLVLFSPTFARMTTDLHNPVLTQVFRILAEKGAFPQPPREVIAFDRFGEHIPVPKINYQSRIALAIQQTQSTGFMSLVDVLNPLIQIDPSVRHVINVSRATRGLSRNLGVPEKWLATEEEYLQAVEQDQQMAQMAQMADVAQKGAGAVAAMQQ